MILFNQVAAAALLLSLTLCLQCAGVAALIEWLKRVLTRDTHNFRPIHAAALVVKSSVAVIVLHGFVILLWAGWYRLRCFSVVGPCLLLLREHLHHSRMCGCHAPV